MIYLHIRYSQMHSNHPATPCCLNAEKNTIVIDSNFHESVQVLAFAGHDPPQWRTLARAASWDANRQRTERSRTGGDADRPTVG
jgi:hypothetical protein